MTDVIYQPAGRAAEYSEWACNIYRGCSHGCSYCFAPNTIKMDRQAFYSNPELRKDYLARVEKDARKYGGASNSNDNIPGFCYEEAFDSRKQTQYRQIDTPILLSFTCDPYQDLDAEMQHTRETIKILHRHNLRVQTLTKGGRRALRDLDLFTDKDAFASSLTLLDDAASAKWERGAASPQERMEVLRIFHEAGIPTWVSLEPVIDPAATLELIRLTHEYVDLYKVGTINYVKNVSDKIDWEQFALDAEALLTSLGKKYYIKDDLKRHLDRAHQRLF